MVRNVSKSICLAGLLLAGCSSTITDYQHETPELHLDKFFNGHLVAYGMVQDFRGKVIRRFRAEINASWQDGEGVLDEQFFFNDGEQQTRCWRLTKTGNQYTGTAGYVGGQASGTTEGNALNWQYVLEIPVNGKVRHIKLNDWLYLVDENNLINRATMSKFGIPVGEITLYIRRESDQPANDAWPACQS